MNRYCKSRNHGFSQSIFYGTMRKLKIVDVAVFLNDIIDFTSGYDFNY